MVGVSHQYYDPEMENICQKEQLRLYRMLSSHLASYPLFATSMDPLPFPGGKGDKNLELESMYRCASLSGTGPMSSVAGLFAQVTGRAIGSYAVDFPLEILVENGGDVYVKNREDLVVVIHAGDVALSGKLGLVITPGEWGICTSSGTHGHSFSKGKADAVTIVCRDTPLADAWATALANQVEVREDIPPLLEKVAGIPEILACVVISGGEVGIRGTFETKLLS